MLADRRATKDSIMARLNLKWLMNGVKPGDLLVFHYSGHGSEVRDRTGMS
jgi:hypothetical protein